MGSGERFRPKSAVYLMPIVDNQILLSRRFQTGWMDGFYSLIAGHLDGNESVNDAMIREAFEEAVIVVREEDLTPATVIHRKSPDEEYIDFFYVITKWQGDIVIGEPNKCDSLDWYPIDNLPENTLPHIKEALNNYQNKVAFSVSGWS
jgi:ADP-ribose pyrophosphatase YjhB (NUDIX family)